MIFRLLFYNDFEHIYVIENHFTWIVFGGTVDCFCVLGVVNDFNHRTFADILIRLLYRRMFPVLRHIDNPRVLSLYPTAQPQVHMLL